MKLVYLSSLRLPTRNAHGFQVMNMCSAFARSGVEVELIVPWRFNLLKEEPFSFYGLKPDFRVKKLPAIDLYPLRIVPERISNFVHLFSFLTSARIYLWFKKFDILYTRETLASLFFPSLVYEIHIPEQMRAPVFAPRKIVVITNHIKTELVRRGLKGERILIAPDATDPSLFGRISKAEARKELGFPNDKKIVLYWGNFKLWKGVDTLAEAVSELKEEFVVMVGATKESDLNRIREKTSKLSNVLVKGFQPPEDAPKYLAAADVLVIPNSAKDENSLLYTSPLKLFEYMAAERPIVVSDLPSLREILNNRNAVFFKPDSFENLATTIKMLLSHEELQKKLARQARQDVEEYTWDKRAEKILDFLSK
ncbi:MAG: glycosyltransferase family 4 protein [Minisyncoccia bacterium]